MEAEHKRRMIELAEVGDPARDPLSRDHYVPGHFTASAFILSPKGDALLLIHHRKLGRWLQPGGHVEPDDVDLLAAARRECAEEVALPDLPLHPRASGPFDLDVHMIPAYETSPEHGHFDVRFLFQASSRNFGVGDEVADARWVALGDIAGLPQADASVLRAVDKLEGYL
jgi:8-oxo-dGTP pyrophosphatase MutT (NUDIX family)